MATIFSSFVYIFCAFVLLSIEKIATYHWSVNAVCFFLSRMICATVFFCGWGFPVPSPFKFITSLFSSSSSMLSSSVKPGLFSSVSGSERWITLFQYDDYVLYYYCLYSRLFCNCALRNVSLVNNLNGFRTIDSDPDFVSIIS